MEEVPAAGFHSVVVVVNIRWIICHSIRQTLDVLNAPPIDDHSDLPVVAAWLCWPVASAGGLRSGQNSICAGHCNRRGHQIGQ